MSEKSLGAQSPRGEPLPASTSSRLSATAGEAELFRYAAVHAKVPEHSPAFMQAVSGGRFFLEREYCFLDLDGGLAAIAYPLRGEYSHEDFEEALRRALARTGAADCRCIGPDLLPRLLPHEIERDEFFVLPANAPIPVRLRRPIARAAETLRVERSRRFSSGHRRLWAEFMARTPLKPGVRELFARTESALSAEGVELLSALDGEDRPVAALLLDFAPEDFVAYIIGAHSRERYVPYATDLLFAALLEDARSRGKEFLHLGLGVHDGIRRFKRKWGGRPLLPFRMAAWKETPAPRRNVTVMEAASSLMFSSALEISEQQIPADQARQRPFAMLWELEKNGARSWIGGTAHFFCCSFEHSFRQLFQKVDVVLLEGPLDEASLDAASRAGRNPGPGTPRVADLLEERDVRILERVVRGPEGFWPRMLNMEMKNPPDVRWFLKNTHPWCALFSLWTAFLERNDWNCSVDLEIWRLGHETGKRVVAMESLEEQLESLESVTARRVADFFRKAGDWPAHIKRNADAYLAGDLSRMTGTSTEFPTRTERVIDQRDQRFRERMRPFLEAGRCVVFVGAAHMLNLRHMLVEDGFALRPCPPPSLLHRLRSLLRRGEAP